MPNNKRFDEENFDTLEDAIYWAANFGYRTPMYACVATVPYRFQPVIARNHLGHERGVFWIGGAL